MSANAPTFQQRTFILCDGFERTFVTHFRHLLIGRISCDTFSSPISSTGTARDTQNGFSCCQDPHPKKNVPLTLMKKKRIWTFIGFQNVQHGNIQGKF